MRTEKLEKHIQISKGKKHSISEASSAFAKRYLQIDDLRNDDNLKFTKDKKGVEVIERDLIIAWDGANAGTIGFGKKGYIGSTLARLRIKEPRIFHSVFLGKFLQRKFDYLRQTTAGATIPHINKSALEGIKVPVFPLPDQIRIATLLSRAEALIEKRRESLRLLDELVKGVFLEMFGDVNASDWSQTKIERLASPRKGAMRTGPFGSSLLHSEFTENGEVRVLGIDNVVNNRFEISKPRFISFNKYETLKQYTVFPEDVLITIMGTNGRSAVVPEGIGLCINTKHLVAITLNKKIANPIFISYSICHDSKILMQLKKQTRGAIMSGLNLTIIKSLSISLPPISLQTQFANLVKRVETLKVKYQESLVELENLYGSLSGRAFRGELDLSGMEVDEALLESGGNEIPEEGESELPITSWKDLQKIISQLNIDFQVPQKFLETIAKMNTSLQQSQLKIPVDSETLQKIQENLQSWAQRLREGITFEEFLDGEDGDYPWAKQELYSILKGEKPFLRQELGKQKKQIIFRLNETD